MFRRKKSLESQSGMRVRVEVQIEKHFQRVGKTEVDEDIRLLSQQIQLGSKTVKQFAHCRAYCAHFFLFKN